MTRISALLVALLLALALALTARTAAAEPRVDLDRCSAFDTTALRHAIERELSAAPPLADRTFAVIVECPDLVTTHLHVEPVPRDGPIARDIDLGEVPGELRLKLLALAVAEFYQVAALAVPAPVPATPPPTTPTADAATMHALAHPTTPSIETRALAPASPRGTPWAIEATAATRVYAATPRPLVQLGVDLVHPWLRAGIRVAAGDTPDTLGTIRPYLATVAVARDIACSVGTTSVCGLVQVEGGVVGVQARASATNTTARDATAGYGQAGLAAELLHHHAQWTFAARIDVAWSQGLIARAANQPRVDLDGGVVIGSLGARWR